MATTQRPRLTRPATVEMAVIATPTELTSTRQMGPLQKIIARRKVAEQIAAETRTPIRAAIREIDEVVSRSTPEQLAAACGCEEEVFEQGIYSEQAVTGVLAFSGFALPVEGFGDGSFLKWFFSDEGREAILKWVETIVKIISILGPIFI